MSAQYRYDSVVSTLKVHSTDPFHWVHSREPAEAPLGSERHHSTRKPRGTFDGENGRRPKPALGTAKTARQGCRADGLWACSSGTTNIATLIGQPDSCERVWIVFDRYRLSHSNSKSSTHREMSPFDSGSLTLFAASSFTNQTH